MNVAFAGAEITALYRVVKQAVNAVAVILIILRGVDAALCRDAVCAASAVLEAKC